MKTLDSVISNYRKRVERHLVDTNPPGISYDKDGNKYWRGKKLVSSLNWKTARSNEKWDDILKLMPEKFLFAPLNVSTSLHHFPELTEKFEKWLNDYYDYLLFIGDTVGDEYVKNTWEHISH